MRGGTKIFVRLSDKFIDCKCCLAVLSPLWLVVMLSKYELLERLLFPQIMLCDCFLSEMFLGKKQSAS